MSAEALSLLHPDDQHHRSLGGLCALWAWIVLACTVVAAFSGLPAQAATGQRVALVVGNAAYADKPLRNPVNDAELMQRTLQELGFEVNLMRNADRRAFLAGLRDFEAKARNADVALFYFAGHGTQVGGNNYLLPLQAQIRSESDVPDEAVDASSVLRRIEDAQARIGLVILDACRDNPYTGSSRSSSRGLGRMSVPTGSIVAYATAPGSTADDGSGHNGLYTEQLARHLAAPGLDLREVFDRTATEVERITGGKQKPREDVGLRGRFVLNATQAGQGSQLASVTPQPTGVSVQPTPQADPDQEAWELAKRRDTVAAYQAYLNRYPQGRFADTARVALESFQPPAATRPVQAAGSANLPPLSPSALPSPPPSSASAPSAASTAAADARFPDGKPITLVVPFAAGGLTDASARLLATELSATLGTPVVIENRAGAGGTLGMAQVGASTPNGLTLLVHHLGMATAEAMYRNLPAAARQAAFEPIGLFSEFPMILAARPNLQTGNHPDALAWLRAQSGNFNMATAGVGSPSHICALVLESALQTRPTLIPYKGTGPALLDLMAGQTDVMCDSGTNLAVQLDTGKLKGLGLVSATAAPTGTAARSLPRLPLPAAGQLTIWHGLYAPKGTPAAAVARLSQALQAATRASRFKSGLELLGAAPVTDNRSTPAGLAQFVSAESARLGGLIRAAGAFAD